MFGVGVDIWMFDDVWALWGFLCIMLLNKLAVGNYWVRRIRGGFICFKYLVGYKLGSSRHRMVQRQDVMTTVVVGSECRRTVALR